MHTTFNRWMTMLILTNRGRCHPPRRHDVRDRAVRQTRIAATLAPGYRTHPPRHLRRSIGRGLLCGAAGTAQQHP